MLTDKIIKAVHEDIPKINSQLEQKANKENTTEIINVLSLGFDNNGSEDNSDKLIDIINKKNNVTLYFPKGEYRFDKNIKFADFKNIRFVGDSSKFVKFNSYCSNGNLFEAIPTKFENEINVTFKGISFINKTNNQVNGFYYKWCSGLVLLEECFVNGFYYNVKIENSYIIELRKTISINALDRCLHLHGCNDVKINGGQYTSGGTYNIVVSYSMCFHINVDFSVYKTTTTNGIKCIASLGGHITGYYEGGGLDSGILVENSSAIKISDINISNIEQNSVTIKLLNTVSTVIDNVSFYRFDDIMKEGVGILCDSNSFETLISNCYFNHISTCIKLSDSTRTRITNCYANPSKITKYLSIPVDGGGTHYTLECVSNLLSKSDIGLRYPNKKIELINVLKYGSASEIPTGYYNGQKFFNTNVNKEMTYKDGKWYYPDGTANS